MPHEVELCRLTLAFPVELCFCICLALMRVVGALFAVEITLTVAPWCWRFVAAILSAEALQARPCLNQRAIDREVIIRQELLHFRVTQYCFQELARNVGIQQAVAVFRERRVIPNSIIDPEPYEPA